MNAPDRWVTTSGSCPSLPFLVDWMGERVLRGKAKKQATDAGVDELKEDWHVGLYRAEVVCCWEEEAGP